MSLRSLFSSFGEMHLALRPLPNSRWINHQPIHGFTDVDFELEAGLLLHSMYRDGPLSVVRVTLNGREIRHELIGPTAVRLRPAIPLEGGRLHIVCLLPEEAGKPLVQPSATHPSPDLGYGLQRPANPPKRHPQ